MKTYIKIFFPLSFLPLLQAMEILKDDLQFAMEIDSQIGESNFDAEQKSPSHGMVNEKQIDQFVKSESDESEEEICDSLEMQTDESLGDVEDYRVKAILGAYTNNSKKTLEEIAEDYEEDNGEISQLAKIFIRVLELESQTDNKLCCENRSSE